MDVHTNNMENFWSLLKRALKAPMFRLNPSTFRRTAMSKRFATTSAT